MEKNPCVYILSDGPRGTLYVGVTSDLSERIWQHKSKVVEGHTKKYNIDRLVWFEQHDTMESAIYREKQIKKWRRQWKVDMVEKDNPGWCDLFKTVT